MGLDGAPILAWSASDEARSGHHIFAVGERSAGLSGSKERRWLAFNDQALTLRDDATTDELKALAQKLSDEIWFFDNCDEMHADCAADSEAEAKRDGEDDDRGYWMSR
jgi:hypothetical protein